MKTITDILLVDDDPAIRRVLAHALTLSGYTAEFASNGREGIALLARQRFRLLITDVFMPENDGFEMIMQHLAARPETRILAMSGGGGGLSASQTLNAARLLGRVRTLAKPFDLDLFQSIVREVLESNEP